MESVIQWRTEAEEKTSETNQMVEKLESMWRMMQARFQVEDDGVTPIRPTLRRAPQVNTNFSEPGLSEPNLGPRNIGYVLPAGNSILRKVDMPIFDGKHPHSWIAGVERRLRLDQYPEEQKLELGSLSLEGDAICWYHEELTRATFKDWMEFKRRLLAHFSPIKRQTLSEVIAESKPYSGKEVFSEAKLVQEKKIFGEQKATTLFQFQETIPMSESLKEEVHAATLEMNQKEFIVHTALAESNTTVTKEVIEVHHDIVPLPREGETVIFEDQLSQQLNIQNSKGTDAGSEVNMFQETLHFQESGFAYQISDRMLHLRKLVQHPFKKQKFLKSWNFKYKKRKRHKDKAETTQLSGYNSRREEKDSRIQSMLVQSRTLFQRSFLQQDGTVFYCLFMGLVDWVSMRHGEAVTHSDDQFVVLAPACQIFQVRAQEKISTPPALGYTFKRELKAMLKEKYQMGRGRIQKLLWRERTNRKRLALARESVRDSLLQYEISVRVTNKFSGSCSNARVKLLKKGNKTLQMRMRKPPHLSRILCKMRMILDLRSLRQLFLVDLKFQVKHKWRSKVLRLKEEYTSE